MKAAVYYETGAPEVLRYEDVPDPVASPGSVLIEIGAISIEGGDTLNRAGGEMATNPHIVGYQCAGTIIEVGEGRHRPVRRPARRRHRPVGLARGDDRGPVGDHVGDPRRRRPREVRMRSGRVRHRARLPLRVRASAVGRDGADPGGRGRRRGRGDPTRQARGRDRHRDRVESRSGSSRWRSLGLDHAVDYSQSGWVDVVRELTGGRGVDLVVDSVGGRILAGSVQCLAYRGRAITVGNAGRDPQPFDISVLSMGNQSITGVFLGAEILNPRTYAMIAGPRRRRGRRPPRSDRRPPVPAERRRGRARLHREPPGRRPGRADSLSRFTRAGVQSARGRCRA